MPSGADGLPRAATDDVRSAIAAAGGAIRFDKYLSVALYGPNGFYTRGGGQAGRRGDFITSPEVGPLFGAVIARALDTWWVELGRPDPYVVVDAGAGPGTLARSVLAAKPLCLAALRYVAVEISAAQRAMHPAGVSSVAVMPTEPFTGVVIANELLDNLPFRLFVHDGGWREAFVTSEGERFVERLVTVSAPPTCLPTSAAHGARVAVQEAARTFVEDALAVIQTGRLIVIDYCTTTESMAGRPWRQWLRAYAGHDRGSHYLSSVGEQDVTVEVALDQLPQPTSVSTQVEFLRQHGIDLLVAEGQAAWKQAAGSPDLKAMTMRSRVREAEALLDPAGLGGFSVVQWRR